MCFTAYTAYKEKIIGNERIYMYMIVGIALHVIRKQGVYIIGKCIMFPHFQLAECFLYTLRHNNRKGVAICLLRFLS